MVILIYVIIVVIKGIIMIARLALSIKFKEFIILIILV